MQRAFGLSIPQTLEEACDPSRAALIVYDMQAGIVSQVSDGGKIVEAVAGVREAARAGGFRVFYTRHMSLPNAAAGVSQLRTAMQWQGVDDVALVRPDFPQGSPQYQIVEELTPGPDEVVIDKVTMSCLAGTPLDIILRDCRIDTFVIVGIALEVGIEPTIRHGMDLGYLPILVPDACGSGDAAAGERSLAALDYTGGVPRADVQTISALQSGAT